MNPTKKVNAKCACEGIKYCEIDKPVRKLVRLLHRKGICTNSSEGGGKGHGAPNFSYVAAHLTKQNFRQMKKNGFLLDKLYGKNGHPLFNGNAIEYGSKSGFYLIGVKRNMMSDTDVERKLSLILHLLREQKRHRKWKGY